MKSILVPVDFSVQAKYAAKVAANIAKITNAKIYLLHMLELPTGVIDPASYGSSNNTPTALLFLKRAHEKFEDFKKLPFFDGIEINTESLTRSINVRRSKRTTRRSCSSKSL